MALLPKQAKIEGASYLAFGRFFPSKTKPEAKSADITLLKDAKTLGLPICAIGGIILDNLYLFTEKVDLIAVVNSLFDKKNKTQVEISAKQLLNSMNFFNKKLIIFFYSISF